MRTLLLLSLAVATLVADTRLAGAQTCDQPLRLTFIDVGTAFANVPAEVRDPNRCGWTADDDASWVTVTSGHSGQGSATIRFNINATTSSAARAAVVRAGREFFVIRQRGHTTPPALTLSPAIVYSGPSFGTVSANVSAAGTVGWQSEVVGDSFLTITSGFSGTGNGAVKLNVSATSHAGPRLGLVRVGGSFLAVLQKGTGVLTCDNDLTSVAPTTLAFGSDGGSKPVQATGPAVCTARATESASWLTVSPTSSTLPATFSVRATASASARQSSVTIAGRSVAVSQSAPVIPCTFSVSPTTFAVPALGGRYTVAVSSSGPCGTWSVSAGSAVTASPTTGSGNGTVQLTVAANTSTRSRTLTVTVAGRTVTLTQAVKGTTPPCVYTVSPTALSVPASGGSANVQITASRSGCEPWTAAGAGSGLIAAPASGAGSAIVRLDVTSNPDRTPRNWALSIAGTAVSVTQAVEVCRVQVTPGSISVPHEGSEFTLAMSITSGCAAPSISSSPWFQQRRQDSASITFVALPSDWSGARPGFVQVGSTRVAITQAAAAPNGNSFDGSNVMSPVVFRPVEGAWYWPHLRTQFGLPGDVPLIADPDGDGILDPFVWRPLPGTSVFYLLPTTGQCPPWYEQEGLTADGRMSCRRPYGTPGDQPLRMDIDGDGKDDLAVYRPGNTTLYVAPSGGACTAAVPAWALGYDGRMICAKNYGLPGDVVVAEDYDGDGRTDLAVWRPSSGFFHISPSSGVCPDGYCELSWGLSQDIPVPARWVHRGRVTPAVFRPSEGNWYVVSFDGSCPAGFTSTGPAHWNLFGCVRQFGLGSVDEPAPRDFDGDGLADIVVVRRQRFDWLAVPSSGACSAAIPNSFVNSDGRLGCSFQWGLSGDLVPKGSR